MIASQKYVLVIPLIFIFSLSFKAALCYEIHVEPYQLETDEKVRSTVLKEHIRYFNYHRGSHQWIELPRDGTVINEIWNFGGKIKVIAHGFSCLPWEPPYWNLKRQATLQIGEEYGAVDNNLNIIAMDWTSLASAPILRYPLAAKSVRYAGLDLAEFLIRLKNGDVFHSWDGVHLIGFSLGAHVMGVAGYHIHGMAGGRIGRITGLDPAGPDFDAFGGKMPKDTCNFLEKTDAKFVDIIHCNMGKPLSWLEAPGHYGSFVQAGHVDFYPNGGERQQDCEPNVDQLACSHLKCPRYYLQSIRHEILACPCTSWKDYQMDKCQCSDRESGGVLMGARCNKSASGRYYLSL